MSSTKFVFFRVEKWIKIATLANPSKKVAHCTQVHVMGPFGLFFMNLLGEVRGGAPIYVYVWEHIVSLY